MTQERFLKLLDDPDRLASISYQELKTLALAYPFAASLRVLLLLKSHYEGHADKLQNLSTASVYVPDRARLFQLMAPRVAIVRANDYAETEVFLELKPIAEAEKELLSRAALEIQTEKKSAQKAAELAADLPVFSKKEQPSVEPPRSEFETGFSAPAFEKVVFSPEKTVEKAAEKGATNAVVSLQNLIAPDPFSIKKAAVEKVDFAAWAAQFSLPPLKAKKARVAVAPAVFIPKPVEKRPDPIEKTEKPAKIEKVESKKAEPKKTEKAEKAAEKLAENPPKAEPKTPKTEAPNPKSAFANPHSKQPSLFDELEAKHESKQDPVRQIAEQSVAEKKEIVSETLAKIYARQGYRDKAIDMYERLMLAFPDKKSTFAAEIEKLRPMD